mmetsp:Transcript_8751/g.26906  ORF Transcript_8751/g.26906 Transcript_8751/m.26906 type:complete len:378 (+) Transcript_8751:2-1135(+)
MFRKPPGRSRNSHVKGMILDPLHSMELSAETFRNGKGEGQEGAPLGRRRRTRRRRKQASKQEEVERQERVVARNQQEAKDKNRPTRLDEDLGGFEEAVGGFQGQEVAGNEVLDDGEVVAGDDGGDEVAELGLGEGHADAVARAEGKREEGAFERFDLRGVEPAVGVEDVRCQDALGGAEEREHRHDQRGALRKVELADVEAVLGVDLAERAHGSDGPQSESFLAGAVQQRLRREVRAGADLLAHCLLVFGSLGDFEESEGRRISRRVVPRHQKREDVRHALLVVPVVLVAHDVVEQSAAVFFFFFGVVVLENFTRHLQHLIARFRRAAPARRQKPVVLARRIQEPLDGELFQTDGQLVEEYLTQIFSFFARVLLHFS